ncbi:hypothetical protein JHJ32_10940 [Parapedobacter sp. ISTM3]|uniref:Uncharacterized protein n=1 Tax=Parapedobacter luteus TaxID=623280 RepID=A0A1T5B4C4_9SPHI|nr:MULTISPECIES: DUF6266 family protein [Parapedobacter]MBK1440503.1 hypothetical protein [Parapedobacter sp. ISTM3]SKB41917.1 hypothetical protein SAMN05660226_01329 [Parapedobacter luteus]
MGIIKKGINGPFKGKAGSVIGSSWKKISYIKGLQLKKSAKRKPSPEQAIQQQRFKLLNDFLRPLSQILEISLKPLLTKTTGVNAAFSLNYDHAFLVDGEHTSLNYKAMQFSHGSLCTAGAEKAWRENDQVTVTWHTKTYGMGGEMDDVAYALVYCPETDRFFGSTAEQIRQDGMATVDLSGNNGTELHTWLFFVDKRQKRASPTVYIPLSSSKP